MVNKGKMTQCHTLETVILLQIGMGTQHLALAPKPYRETKVMALHWFCSYWQSLIRHRQGVDINVCETFICYKDGINTCL